MDGILLIDKPEGLSSHDIVSQLKKTFSLRKIGHGGTLDPLASGLLIMLIGKATRLAEFVIGHDKTYQVTAFLGEHRDTFDADGQIIDISEKILSEEQIRQAFIEFPREYLQTPPAYSAKKVSGLASYKLARKGQPVKLKPSLVKIRKLELLNIRFPTIEFIATVSSGTYIRSLVVDIAETLGTFAYVKQLRRIQSGFFDISNAHKFSIVLNMSKNEFRKSILPMSLAVANFPKITLAKSNVKRFITGQALDLQNQLPDGFFSVFSENDIFVGICKIQSNNIISRKVLHNEDIS